MANRRLSILTRLNPALIC